MQDNKINNILKSEYSKEFDEKRKRAMVTSYYKYGKAALNYPKNVDAIASLEQRLSLYFRFYILLTYTIFCGFHTDKCI